MLLVTLELIKGRQVWVAVGQINDQTDDNLVAFNVIKEGTAGVLGTDDIQRPAGSVNHQTRLVLGGVDIPDFLDADTVVLRIRIGIQVVLLDQLLADVTTAAFGEQSVLATQFHAGGVKAFLRVAFAVNTQVTGENAFYYAILIDQRFLGGKARIDFNAQVLGLLSQPAAQIAQGDDVVTFVMHGLGDQHMRDLGRFGFAGQHVDVIAGHRGVQRCFQLFPIGEQLLQRTGFKHRTGENVGADFGAFFNNTDADLLASFSSLLLDTAGGG